MPSSRLLTWTPLPITVPRVRITLIVDNGPDSTITPGGDGRRLAHSRSLDAGVLERGEAELQHGELQHAAQAELRPDRACRSSLRRRRAELVPGD